MSVNVATASGTKTLPGETIGGEEFLYQKQVHGASGSNAGPVSTANPLPVHDYPETNTMQAGATQVTPVFAKIALTATGTLVAAVASKKIRVLALAMTIEVITGNETYTFNSGAAGTALTGAFGDTEMTVLTTNLPIPIVLPFNPMGWFETAAGALLELALAGTTPNAQGCLTYIAV